MSGPDDMRNRRTEERRHDIIAINSLIALVEGLSERLHELSDAMHEHTVTVKADRERIILDALAAVVPDGDGRKHIEYHKSVTAKNLARAAFLEKMRDELAKWGLILFCGWCIVQLWQAFILGPKH